MGRQLNLLPTEQLIPVSPEIERIRAENRGIDPDAMMSGGLQEGDTMLFDWVTPEALPLRGCQLSVKSAAGVLRRWNDRGLWREPGGRLIFASFLRTVESVDACAALIAKLAGYSIELTGATHRSRTFRVGPLIGESYKLRIGDLISCDAGVVNVERPQGTIDMNLYRSGTLEGSLFRLETSYLKAGHHGEGIARLLAEANGFMFFPRAGKFEVVRSGGKT